MAKGRLAHSAMTTQPKTAARMVAVVWGPRGIPPASSMAGFTMMM